MTFISLLGWVCAGLAPVAQGQVVTRWFNGTGGTQTWNSGPNWFPATVPNASGDIASIVANITANQIIDLSGSVTVGTLNLGDFSSNQTYTIGVVGDTLNFDNRFWGSFDLGAAAQLNKVMGGADVIAANVELVSDLIIYNRVALTISGQINDSALGKSLRKMGTSNLTLTGINGYTGDTIISTTGGTVFLNATGGNAINSQLIRLGNSSLDGGSTVRLNLQQNEQINDTAVIRFDGASGREAFFQLNSRSETIQGISDYTGRGVIENTGGSASTLTLNTAGIDYFYNGFFRNNGTGTTALVKNDAGKLTLSGGQVTFTGGLTINGGTVQLSNIRLDNNNQAQWGSTITNNGALELHATAEWVGRTAISGTGSVTKLGNSTLNLTANNTYTGATSVANGTLRLSGPNGSLSGTSGITLSGRTDAVAAINTLTLANRRAASVGGGSTSSGSALITVSSTADIVPGMTITGTNIPGGATVLSVGSGTQFTISAPATGSGSSLSFNVGAANNTNRVNDAAPITSLGGTIRFENNGDAANTYTETLGGLTLTSGLATIATGKIGSAADPLNSTLTFGGLARSAGTALNFTNIGGAAIGSGVQNRVMFTGGLTLDDGIVGGWATVGNDWATYGANGVAAYSGYSKIIGGNTNSWASGASSITVTDATGLVVGMQVTGSNGIQNGTTISSIAGTTIGLSLPTNGTGNTPVFGNWGSGQNVNFTATTGNTIRYWLPTGSLVNSMRISDTSNRILNLQNKEIVVDSGGILVSGANHQIQTGIIKVGTPAGHAPAAGELVTNIENGRILTVTSQFSDNGATPMKLVVNGTSTGKLIYNPAAAASFYTGGLTIVGGTMEVNRESSLGTGTTADYITLNGGAIEFAAAKAGSPTPDYTISDAGTRQINIGPNGGRIELDQNETLTIADGVDVTGPGRFTLGGADATGGALFLNSVLSVTGGLTVTTGRLELNNAANTFSGGVTINGGTLQLPTTGSLPTQSLDLNLGTLLLMANDPGGSAVGPTLVVSSLAGTGVTAQISTDATSIEAFDQPALLIVNQDSNTTYAGRLMDVFGDSSEKSRLSLMKMGTGILRLSGSTSGYRGTTQILGGLLEVTKLGYYGVDLSSIGAGDFNAVPNSAQGLTISSGAALSFVGNLPSITDRSFTIGTGPEAGGIYANGTVVGATLEFQEYFLGAETVEFDTPNVGATLTLGGRNTGQNIFGLRLIDNGTGYLSVMKTGPGTWVLGNVVGTAGGNTYSGSTKIYEGRLVVTTDGALGTKGSSGSPVEVLNGVLDLRNVNYTASGSDTEDLLLAGGRLETSSGNSTWAGKVDVVANLGPNISVGRDSTLTLAGEVTGGQAGLLSVDKDGFGDLILSGANTYLGTTRIRDGALILDYSDGLANNKLSDVSALLFGGGRLGGTLVLKKTTAGSLIPEVIGSTTLDRGSHEILLDNSTTFGDVTVNLGNITRNAGATLDVEMGGLARTTRANNASGILGSWATVAHTDWARKDAAGAANAFIVPLASYVVDVWTGLLSNTDAQNNFAPAASSTTNTLRFNQPASSIAITLSGDNTLNSGGILVTPNVTQVNRISGGTLTAGTDSGNELVVQQFSTSGPLVIDSVLTDRTPTPIGFQLLGPGMLALNGDNTFTGILTIGGGTLTVNRLTNGGIASPIGQAPANDTTKIVIGGGTLDYAGESVEIDRAIRIKDFGALSVNDEDMTLTIGGSETVANVGTIFGDAGTAEWSKTGSGTLRLLRRETSGGATGIQLLDVQDGKLILEYGYSTTPSTPGSPTPPNAVDRLFNTNANFRVSGGDFELIGDDYVYNNQHSFQRFFNQFQVGPGASEIKVTSQASLNPLLDQTTTLGLGDPNNPQAIVRELGGTVLFVENANGGRAILQVATLAVDTGVVIPWATYLDTTNLFQPGVNNFAAIEQLDNGIVSADSKSLYSVKSDPNNWFNDGTEHISEEAIVPFVGANPVAMDAKIATLRFFSDNGAGSISVTDNPNPNTLTLTQGAILVGYNVRNNIKTITGGTLTSEYLPADGQAELMIHNYNVSTPFRIESVIADPITLVTPAALNLVHTGTGTTSLFAANTYTGATYLTGGVLRLENATAIPGGIAATGGASALTIDGGVLGLTLASGDFTRDLGAGVDQVQWLASGGFAAYGVDRNVNIGGATAQVRWGLNGFVPDGDTLVLSSQDADKKITFQNPIELGIMDRLARVENGMAGEDAALSGALTGYGSLTKNGEGTLRLSATNTHTGGTTLAEGTLIGATSTAFGTGPINVGTTGNTEANDALNLVLEGGSNANAFSIGNKNTAGITTIDPVGGVTLNGTIATEKQTFVAPEVGTTLDLTGNVSGSGGLTLVDGGTLKLQGTNSFGTGRGVAGTAIDGSTIIRSGTVEVYTSSALGDGTKAVELGDAMIAPVTVDTATTGASLIYAQGTFDPQGNGITGSSNGIGAFYNVSNTIDGVTYTSGDAGTLILVKDQFDSPDQNGIYEIVFEIGQPSGTMNLKRVDTGFPLVPLYKDYGQGIIVTNGTVNGGKDFFLALNVDAGDFTDGDGPLNTDPYQFKIEQTFNPDVSLLVGASLSSPITNDLDVNDTNGTGTTTIGAMTTLLRGTVEFSGDVTLQSQVAGVENKDLFLTSTACTDVLFSGVIGESAVGDLLNLIKVGTGTVILSGANTYDGFTEVREGLLKLDHASALGAGNLNIAGGVVGLTVASGDLTRTLGTGNGEVQWTDAGGFAAYGGDANPRTVNVGALVTWGSGGFVPTGDTLLLGAGDADAKVILSSAIDLGAVQRTVQVAGGPAAVEGELSGALTGSGASLNKTGQGALLLSGTNTYSGGTTLAQGTLQGAKTGVFGSGAIQVGGLDTLPGDALKLELLGDPTISALTNTVTNNITVGTQNNLGTTSIDATDGSAATDAILSGTVTLNRSVFVGPDAGTVLQMGGGVTGSGRITLVDGGTLLLTGANTYGTSGGPSGAAVDGGTVVRDGTIQVNSTTALGATTIELGDASSVIDLGLGVQIDRASNGMALSECPSVSFSAGTFSGVSTTFDGTTYNAGDIGTRLLIKDEAGNPERNGIYQITAVSGETMTLTRDTAYDASGEMIYGGATLQIQNGSSQNRQFFLTNTVTTVNTSPVLWRETNANPNVALLVTSAVAGGTITNAIDLNKSIGTGTHTLGGLDAGAGALTTGTVTFSGNVTLRSQTAAAESLELEITSSTLTDNGVTLSGTVSDADPLDSLILRKTGVGVVTLTGDNPYNGASSATFVDGGILLVNNATGSGTGTGAVIVSNAGTVLGGTGTIAGDTTINADAILQPGGAVADANATFDSAVESLAFGGSLTLAADSTAIFQLAGNGNNDQALVTGTLSVDTTTILQVLLNYTPSIGHAFNLLDWGTLSYAGPDLADQLVLPGNPADWDTSAFNLTGVLTYVAPEPGRVALLMIGLAPIILRRRRR